MLLLVLAAISTLQTPGSSKQGTAQGDNIHQEQKYPGVKNYARIGLFSSCRQGFCAVYQFLFPDKLPVLIDPQARIQPISQTHLRWDGKAVKTVKAVAGQPQVLFQKEEIFLVRSRIFRLRSRMFSYYELLSFSKDL